MVNILAALTSLLFAAGIYILYLRSEINDAKYRESVCQTNWENYQEKYRRLYNKWSRVEKIVLEEDD